MKIYDYNGRKNICGDRLREARVVQRLRQEDLAAKIQTMGVNMERDSQGKMRRNGNGTSASYQKGNRRILGGIKRSYGGRQDMPPFFFRRGRNTNAQTLNVDGSP